MRTTVRAPPLEQKPRRYIEARTIAMSTQAAM